MFHTYPNDIRNLSKLINKLIYLYVYLDNILICLYLYLDKKLSIQIQVTYLLLT